MLKLYGHVTSRAARCLWALEELGIEYEHLPIGQFNGDTRTPEFLAINPNGKVPVLVDDTLKLFESMAINLYLAANYSNSLWPATAADRALTMQWSFWGMTAIEPPLVRMMNEVIYKQEHEADAQQIDLARQELEPPLKVLDGHLAGRQYLFGDAFAIADLNVASVIGISKLLRYSLTPYPNVDRWVTACWTRPANQRVDPQL